MEIHPSQIPTSKIFNIKDFSEVAKVLEDMFSTDFNNESGFKILMPKDQDLAKRIGYIIVNELNKGLRMQNYAGKVRYFVYHYDAEHYAIVLVSEEKLSELHA